MSENLEISALEEVKALLGKRIRIRISDGRLIEGLFECLDREMNFIVGSAMEYHGVLGDLDAPNPTTTRSIGMAMVPGSHVQKCYVVNS